MQAQNAIFTVENENGRKFNVRLVRKGDRYGLNNCRVHDEDKALVEFYDATQDPNKFGICGQFVSRYYLDTLTGRDGWGRDLRNGSSSLALNGGVEAWTLDPWAVGQAVDWAASQVYGVAA